MNDWHVALHCWTGKLPKSRTALWHGRQFEALDVSAEELTAPFPITFDQLVHAIDNGSHSLAEFDGSFAINGPNQDWRLCGNFYEAGQRVHYVELQGRCPKSELEKFIGRLGWPEIECVYQIIQAGCFLSHQQFCTLAFEP